MAEETQNVETTETPIEQSKVKEPDVLTFKKDQFNKRLEQAKRAGREEFLRELAGQTEDGLSPEELLELAQYGREARARQAQEEEAKAREQGNWKQLEEKLRQENAEKEKRIRMLAEEKDREIKMREEKLNSYLVRNSLSEALTGAGILSESLGSALRELVAPDFPVRFVVEGEDVTVHDRQGNIIYGDGGVPLTPKQYAQQYLQERPFFLRANQKAGIGANGSSDMTRLTPQEIQEKAKQGKAARLEMGRQLAGR